MLPKIQFEALESFDFQGFDGFVLADMAAMGAILKGEDEFLTQISAKLDDNCESLELSVLPHAKASACVFQKAKSSYRDLGASLAAKTTSETAVIAASEGLDELLLGYLLRYYAFDAHRAEKKAKLKSLTIATKDVDAAKAAFDLIAPLVEGVHFTRDLVNEPANILTTTEFANRIEGLSALGVKIEILDEAALENIGMRALLGVGQGSDMPSKVAIMRWEGAEGAPLALVGKGVVFDTGGISIKPAAEMHEMTMDMGGAATVCGVMKTLALRKAKAHVIGIVGLVENMPSGNAQRPGDIVTSLKGDTIEILNTDAEGRLVLADILWYAQETFKPRAVIDLATLTGAIIVALGFENAGVFSNDDEFVKAFMNAAKAEGEGAWHMPIGEAYKPLLKSRSADIANIGGRYGGAVTAAQFLENFVKPEIPWIHLDIAGVAYRKKAEGVYTDHATGWGVLALNRLVQDQFEKG